jgi:hypothetical protein
MPNNKLETIKAFDSKMELIDANAENTRLINGEHYIIDESCFKMTNGSYYRINSGKIYYNHTNKLWQRTKRGLVFGILNTDVNNIAVVGYYEPTEKTVKLSYGQSVFINKRGEKEHRKKFVMKKIISNTFLDDSDKNPLYCVSVALCLELGFIESLSDGNYYCKSSLSPYEIKSMSKKGRARYDFDLLPYNIADNNALGNSIKKGYKIAKHEGNKLDKDLLKIIGNKSFGLEIETSLGHVPEPILHKNGLVPLRDGSIGGVEYTTVPLEGIKGVATLRSVFSEMNKRCETDEQCSLHIHFGKYPCTKKSILSLYTLCYRLQNEMFEIVPPYKRDVQYFANKRGQNGRVKDHCQPLSGLALNTNRMFKENADKNTVINEEFKKVFQFLADGTPEDDTYNFETRKHPKEGARKWNFNSRYYHVNLLPLMFSNSKTVEFRLHQSTIHYSVMVHWMLICSSLLTYAENNQDKILKQREKITLLDVISPIKDVNTEIYDKLSSYINYRRTVFNNDRYENMYAEINRDRENVSLPIEFQYE